MSNKTVQCCNTTVDLISFLTNAEQSKDFHGGCSALKVPISSEICPGEDVSLNRHYSDKKGSPCLPRDEL